MPLGVASTAILNGFDVVLCFFTVVVGISGSSQVNLAASLYDELRGGLEGKGSFLVIVLIV